jgi:putative PIN family toxin of toxin-antitoxin system
VNSIAPRGVIDTSVLVAGVAGFKPQITNLRNPSARLLREWVERGIFVWLVSEEILDEYKEVLRRLGVRRNLIGNIINLLREEAELVEAPVTVELSPDPADNPFCACAKLGNAAFIVTLNPKDFPQRRLHAKVIAPGAALPTTAPRRVRNEL